MRVSVLPLLALAMAEKSCDPLSMHLLTRDQFDAEVEIENDQFVCGQTLSGGECIPLCPSGYELEGAGPGPNGAISCLDGSWSGRPCCAKAIITGAAASLTASKGEKSSGGFKDWWLAWIIPLALLLLCCLGFCLKKFCCAKPKPATKAVPLPRYVKQKTPEKALVRPETPQESIVSEKPLPKLAPVVPPPAPKPAVKELPKAELPKPAVKELPKAVVKELPKVEPKVELPTVEPVVSKAIAPRPVPLTSAAVRRRSSSPGLRENAVYTERSTQIVREVAPAPVVIAEKPKPVPVPASNRVRPDSADRVISRTSVGAAERGDYGAYVARDVNAIEGKLVKDDGAQLTKSDATRRQSQLNWELKEGATSTMKYNAGYYTEADNYATANGARVPGFARGGLNALAEEGKLASPPVSARA